MANNKKKYNTNDTQSEESVATYSSTSDVIVDDASPVEAVESVVTEEKEVTPKAEPVVKNKEEKKMEEKDMQPILNKQYTTGKTVVLDKADVYPTSKSTNIRAKLTGTYYMTSGKLEDGRYRISKVKSPDKKHAVGYINADVVK